jgi:hypothetical protein
MIVVFRGRLSDYLHSVSAGFLSFVSRQHLCRGEHAGDHGAPQARLRLVAAHSMYFMELLVGLVQALVSCCCALCYASDMSTRGSGTGGRTPG